MRIVATFILFGYLHPALCTISSAAEIILTPTLYYIYGKVAPTEATADSEQESSTDPESQQDLIWEEIAPLWVDIGNQVTGDEGLMTFSACLIFSWPMIDGELNINEALLQINADQMVGIGLWSTVSAYMKILPELPTEPGENFDQAAYSEIQRILNAGDPLPGIFTVDITENLSSINLDKNSRFLVVLLDSQAPAHGAAHAEDDFVRFKTTESTLPRLLIRF